MIAVLILNDKTRDKNEVTVGNNHYLISKYDILRRLEDQPRGSQVMFLPGAPIKKATIHHAEVPKSADKYTTNATAANTTKAKNKPMGKSFRPNSSPKEVPPQSEKHASGKTKCDKKSKIRKNKLVNGPAVEDHMSLDDVVLLQASMVPNGKDSGTSEKRPRISDETNLEVGDGRGKEMVDLKTEKVYHGAEAIHRLRLIENRSKIYRDEKANKQSRRNKMKDRCIKVT